MVGNAPVGPPCNTSDVIWSGDAAKKSLKIAMAASRSPIYDQPYCTPVIVGAAAETAQSVIPATHGYKQLVLCAQIQFGSPSLQ